MGFLDKKKERAAERRAAAELAERQQAEAEAVVRVVRELKPSARLQQPTWASALRAKGIELESVLAVANGDSGAINSRGPSAMGMPNRRAIGTGAVALAADALAYIFVGRSGVEVEVRRRSEIEQMRKSNMGGTVWILFEGDRSFPGRGELIGFADNWELSAPNHSADAVRAIFLGAGYDF